MLSSIKTLLDALEDKGILYCHWKSNEHLGEALDGDTDLDVLFDPAQRTELERVFDECGLKRFRATPLMQYNAIEDFIGFDREEAKIWHVHTHYRMTLGEKHLKGYTITPWGPILLKDRVRGDDGVWTSDPADELVLLFCRVALKLRWRDAGKKLGKDDRKEMAWLLERTDKSQVLDAANRLLGEKSAAIIGVMLDQKLEKKAEFRRLQSSLRKELRPFTFYSRFSSWLMRTKREIFWLIGGVKRRLHWNSYVANRRISPAGGAVIAILGSDGAGKTTTLSYVKKEFNKKIDTAVIYFGSGDGSSSLLRKPMKLIAKKLSGRADAEKLSSEDNKKSKRKGLKARLIRIGKIVWAVALAQEKKSKLRQLTKARNNGILVLTDRYPQVTVPGINDGPLLYPYRQGKGLLKRLADWEYRIYESALINPPDLAIKLFAPPEIALERKPNMTKEMIEKKIAVVKALNICEKNVEIDTARSFETTRSEVMQEIWKII